MNITSLLITLVGIIVIVALYLMSRIAQSKKPKMHATQIPDLKNKDGSRFTSVLDDIPATDGSTPAVKKLDTTLDNSKENNLSSTHNKVIDDATKDKATESPSPKKQLILFISAKDKNGLEGNRVKTALLESGLTLGDKDIYHYFNNSDSNKQSLFRIANGTAPWTLKAEDLDNKKLAGLSIIMFLKNKNNERNTIKTFISVSKDICKKTNGILKNQQQQPFTKEDDQFLNNLK